MTSPPGGERGSVTVEFAVALPVVTVVLGLVLGGVVLAGEQARMQVAAAVAARAAARGDGAAAAGAAGALAPGAAVRFEFPSGLVCAVLRADRRMGPMPAVAVSARGCAAAGGR
ncbi:hypothetical protein DEI81_05340 [Curtobacterium sp. MCBD17_013]|uniref:TadE family type IV pilus minor pilin n=1 Tax=Curtobacterium sp. MCBD17_013 TaxID=2175668 RepID=UPI000DA9F27B|nr:TadE family type IV pilus minor pilin [Curtobacterium sp. MCBD17_013]PZF64383.1 hypothetical protein DEI81_05340 [Curtobacterium sp. MCBD17_013]